MTKPGCGEGFSFEAKFMNLDMSRFPRLFIHVQ